MSNNTTIPLTAKFRPDGSIVISSPDMPGFRYLLSEGEGLSEAIRLMVRLTAEAKEAP